MPPCTAAAGFSRTRRLRPRKSLADDVRLSPAAFTKTPKIPDFRPLLPR
jgi:hypothetical protein